MAAPRRAEPDAGTFERQVAALFHERFPSLFRYLDRLTGDPDLAADLAQEAFVRLYTRGNLPDDPRAWLGAVATNLYRDAWRRDKRRTEIAVTHVEEVGPVSGALNPDEALEERDTRREVRRILERLSPRDRQLLLLRHEGYSYRELAQAVGVAESGVGTLLLRATRAFRAAYEAYQREIGGPGDHQRGAHAGA